MLYAYQVLRYMIPGTWYILSIYQVYLWYAQACHVLCYVESQLYFPMNNSMRKKGDTYHSMGIAPCVVSHIAEPCSLPAYS